MEGDDETEVEIRVGESEMETEMETEIEEGEREMMGMEGGRETVREDPPPPTPAFCSETEPVCVAVCSLES